MEAEENNDSIIYQQQQETSDSEEEDALQTLIDVNNIDNVLPDGVESTREIPPTPQLLSTANKGRLSAKLAPEEEMDDEEMRTHRYWQKWGKKTARDIVKTIDKENVMSKKQKRKELVYSARVHANRYQNLSDSDSEGTEISLLTCSSVGKPNLKSHIKNNVTMRKRAKLKNEKEKEKEEEDKVDWSKYSSGKLTTTLDALLRKDRAMLSSSIGVQAEDMQVFKQKSALDFMPSEVRDLVYKAAYTKGVRGSKKSISTENIITYLPKSDKKRETSNTSSSNSRPVSSAGRKSSNLDMDTHKWRPVKQERLKYIAAHINRIGRSDSYSGIMNCDFNENSPGNVSVSGSVSGKSMIRSVFGSRHSAKTAGEPDSVKKYQDGLKGIPDFEGKFTGNVREKIRRTVSALSRKTGYGDSLNTIADVEGEKGVYIEADYAKIPKYPQRVLITPELSKIIRIDIRKRMGRPRYHEIRKADMRYFDRQNPPLDRSNRNLIIFNWLLSIDESHYELTDEPQIVDFEGERRNITYGAVLKHGDILSSMQRAQTAMSRVSTAMDECSTFKTRSDFTADVSGMDDDDDFSVGTADDISEFYSRSSVTLSRT